MHYIRQQRPSTSQPLREGDERKGFWAATTRRGSGQREIDYWRGRKKKHERNTPDECERKQRKAREERRRKKKKGNMNVREKDLLRWTDEIKGKK